MTDETTPKPNLFGKTAAPTESTATAAEKPAEPKAEPAPEAEAFEVRYASGQIARLRIGQFQFENGVLIIRDEAKAERFEQLLDKATVRTKQSVRKIDRAAGEEIAKKFLATKHGQMIRGGDTTGNIAPAATPGEQDHVA